MRLRPLLWLLVSVACFLGAAYFWHLGNQWKANKAGANAAEKSPALAPQTPGKPVPSQTTVTHASTAPVQLFASTDTNAATSAVNSQLQYRLSNTRKTVGQLERDDQAILLANALIDLRESMDLKIPKSLQSEGDPGTYIVQSRGPIDEQFRARLRGAGASIVSYIPNNAYLVRTSGDAAQRLRGTPGVQAVLPYEPYYKLNARLLEMVLGNKPVPPPPALNVVVFNDAVDATVAALQKLGGRIVQKTGTPFGQQFTVRNLFDVPAIAALPGVGNVEPSLERRPANDLTRPRIAVATDSTNELNYLGLNGNNVFVNVNDTGVDGNHVGLVGRVFGPASTNDLDGHGTHVAGIIAGDGTGSSTATNVPGSLTPPTDKQFRGMAPLAKLYSQVFNQSSDLELQEAAAQTNAWISNNSWWYDDNAYDLASASFDAAVRDSLSGVTGSQPVLYVFAAGNSGGGNDIGLGGNSQSIQSPGTAKNVITVGAIEQFRNITNVVTRRGDTNAIWLGETDSADQVAAFSSRGNVGIGVEGDFGRFKPDVVAPGVFVVSARSPTWNQAAYYNPTSSVVNTFRDQVVDTNSLQRDSIFVPDNAVELSITVANTRPEVDQMPIYLRNDGDFPTTGDFVGFNHVSLPPDKALVTGTVWFFAVGNPTNVPVKYDVTTRLLLTNELGDYFTVLSNLNNGPGPNYRYETGTSMAAAAASGTLALLADFFTNKLSIVPSPALMKAMLINGARPVNNIYDLAVKKDPDAGDNRNYQGWGLINLTNSLPSGIQTNGGAGALATLQGSAGASSPLFIYDQDATNALGTGERSTVDISVDPAAINRPLRVTLVWTDPPGNPAAGIKLVNDLDLIVTNKEDKTIYCGNNIPAGANFTSVSDTNSLPVFDSINNVENIIIPPPLSTNGYSITVLGRNVNVNAVTANTNKVAQDYALVISSGASQVANALKIVTPQAFVSSAYTNVTYMTNQFVGQETNFTGGLLLNQHVGANSPLIGNGIIPLGVNTVWGTNAAQGRIFLGSTNQWHFYVVTNTEGFTNAAFLTFLPPTLATPRMGVTNYLHTDEASRIEADIDMYVTTDPGLLELNPGAIAGATKAVTRGGTEVIAYTNAVSGAYYIGIHSEDQQAAEYGFFGGFSLLPFDEDDGNGVTLRGINVPEAIPDGSNQKQGVARIMAICTRPVSVRRVIVTNLIIFHENLGDLVGNISHNQQFTVLHDHRPGNGVQEFLFEDNGESYNLPNVPPYEHTDGPGSLRDFVGERGEGLWLLTEIDDAPGATGRVDNVRIRLERQADLGSPTDLTIQPHSFAFAFVDVPPEATNLIIVVRNTTTSGPLPMDLYVRFEEFPDLLQYDHKFPLSGISTPQTNMINRASRPPLRTGRYYIGIYNPNDVVQTVKMIIQLQLDPNSVSTFRLAKYGPEPILDDAVSYSKINVPYQRRIARVDVDVAIQHPRISDMALTLISPAGKRILLFENRGGQTADLGFITVTTNSPPSVTNTSGFAMASTNVVPAGGNSGTLVIDFDFYQAPDTLDVYYDGTNIFSSGLVSGSGTFSIPFGPGLSTDISIVMNQNNNPENPGTRWTYTPRVITQTGSYFTFSENTNFTQIPIKFAVPPFTGTIQGPVVMQDGFEFAAWGQYSAPAYISGWHLDSGSIDLLHDGLFGGAANEGLQYIDINGTSAGTMATNVPTVAGTAYRLTFAYSQNADADIMGVTPMAAVNIGGSSLVLTPNLTNNSWANLDWQSTSIVFTATAPFSTIQLQALGSPNNSYGVLFDNFRLQRESSVEAFCFPEESLQDLVGDNAKGEWKLEMWDSRAGPTNVASQLLSWQLRFIFDQEIVQTTPLFHDVPVTNTIAPCQIAYFSVDVPSWAKFITNTLVSATAPVNVWANTNKLPAFGGTNAGDFPLFPVQPTTAAVRVLDASTIPTGQYFIGIENPCGSGSNATVVFKIEFDLTALSNGVPVTSTNLGNDVPRYFSFDVSTNALAVSFQLTNMSGNFDLIARRGGPLPTPFNFDYGSFSPGTQDEQIIVFTNSIPVPLAPGRWYLGVFNTSLQSNVFTIVASEFTNDFRLVTLTNAVPYTNSVASGDEDHYRFVVSGAAVRAQFEINGPSGDMVLVARKGLPLPSINFYSYLSDNPFLNDEMILVFTNSTPAPLTPGDWFLTAVNVSGTQVDYSIKATEWFSTGRPITITEVTYTPPEGTNVAQFCITWNSLPGIHYYIQGIADLATTNWTTVSPTITAVGFTTTYCVPIEAGNRFFRVVEGLALSSFAPPQNFSIAPSVGGFNLRWRGAAASQYQLQWTTNLAPSLWKAFNPTNITSTNVALPYTSFTNGIYSFLDDGTQPGFPVPRPPQTFYRVLLLP